VPLLAVRRPLPEADGISDTVRAAADEQERVAIAAQALDRQSVVLSGPKAAPLFVWSKQELNGPQIKARVEAAGNNPYTVLGGWPLPMSMLLQIPRRPDGYGYCWLVVVEIRARNV
jgi:hypothetical protein